jgi:hypothetical protein
VDQDEPIETDEDIRNDLWFKKNYLDLINEHPNQWIAVSGERVISSGNTKRAVEAEAKEHARGRVYSLYFVPPSDIMP